MREYLLKDVAFIKNGYAFDSKKYSNKGIPIIRIADIKEKIDLKNCVFINGKVDNEFLVKKGSLLIALSGATTGKMGVYFEDKIAYLNQRICSVYTKKEDVLQEYLVYFLKSMQKKIIKNSYGGAQPNISSRWIENIKIKVPDIRVQKKISKRLELLENNIDYRKKQLNYLKELKKSLFTRMFGDIKTNNKNWQLYEIREISNILTRGKTPKYTLSSNIFVINQACIYWDKIKYENIKFHIEEENLLFLKNKDILINSTGTGTLGRMNIIGNIINEKFTVDSHVMLLRLKKEKASPIYFINIFMGEEYQKELILKCVNGSTNQIELSKEKFSKFKIPIPPIELQNKFAERIEKIEKLSFNFSNAIFFTFFDNKRGVA